MKSLKCPECGGAIQYDNQKKISFCPYCGVKIEMPEKLGKLDKFFSYSLLSKKIKADTDRRNIDKEIALAKEQTKQAEAEKTTKYDVIIIVVVCAMIALIFLIIFGMMIVNGLRSLFGA